MARNRIRIREHKHELFLFAFFFVYIFVWSVITIGRYYSLHAYIYDAGLFMQEWSDVLYVHWTLSSFFLSFTSRGLKFVFFPIILLKNYPLLFIFQTVWIALGSPFIYYIAISKGIDKTESLVIASIYLFFFPLAGANFFDIHNITFFPTLFLAAYYFLIKGKIFSTVALFFLASITKYPMSLLVSTFALVLIVEYYLECFKDHDRSDKRKIEMYVIILIISLSLFLSRYLFLLISAHLIGIGDIHISGFFGPKITYYDVFLSILLFFGPVLFFPMLSIKTLPFSLGYLALIIYSGFWGYAYPYGITTIYIYQLAPFLMLGVLDVISGHSILSYTHESILKSNGKRKISRHLLFHKSFYRKVKICTILMIVMIMALFLEPYGPLNSVNPDTSFNLKQTMDINLTEYNDILKLVDSVPLHDPYVVVQNGLPEFFPRDFNLSGNPMNTPGVLEVPGVGGGLLYNLTYINSNGTWEKLRIDYVIADPYQSTYYESLSSPYNLSMFDLVRELYKNGSYGIYSEIDGMIVLKHNYSGPPKYYIPAKYSSKGNNLYSHFIRNGNVTISDMHTTAGEWQQVWRTPTMPISPGMYEINMTYAYQSPTSNNSVYNVIISLSGNTIDNAYSFDLTPHNLGTTGKTHVLHFYVRVLNFTNTFMIDAQIPPNNTWNGAFNVSSISINQINSSSIYIYNGDTLESHFIRNGNVVLMIKGK